MTTIEILPETASLGIGRTAVSISGSHTYVRNIGRWICRHWGYGGNGQRGCKRSKFGPFTNK